MTARRRPPAAHQPLRSAESLRAFVEEILGPEPIASRTLWLILLDAGSRPLPVIVPIHEVPDRPEAEAVGNIFSVIGQILRDLAPDGSVVFALHRPGPATVRADDRAWFGGLYHGARAEPTVIRGMFLGVQGYVRELTLDDAA